MRGVQASLMARPEANNFAINNKENGMARSYLVFGDIEGKLGVLRVECTRSDRSFYLSPELLKSQ
jgi:hypothetical protein